VAQVDTVSAHQRFQSGTNASVIEQVPSAGTGEQQ
jgi:hypothetical protein